MANLTYFTVTWQTPPYAPQLATNWGIVGDGVSTTIGPYEFASQIEQLPVTSKVPKAVSVGWSGPQTATAILSGTEVTITLSSAPAVGQLYTLIVSLGF